MPVLIATGPVDYSYLRDENGLIIMQDNFLSSTDGRSWLARRLPFQNCDTFDQCPPLWEAPDFSECTGGTRLRIIEGEWEC